jgi:hypothetical protein
MTTFIHSPKDFWTGVIYLGAGALGGFVGREYSFGSARRMGPGYFPFYISCLLLVFGVVTVVRSFMTDGETVGALAWKAIALVIGSVIAFGLLLPRAGLIVAMIVMVLMSVPSACSR